jgi:3-hydroxybutyryl-CoA dehydratase
MAVSNEPLASGCYGLTQLAVGDWIDAGHRVISVEMIDAFADLSGDHFEIHMNTDAARAVGFRDRVAHGLLVLSVVDGLKNTADAQFHAIASLGWDWTFGAPVFVGDRIQVTMMVTGLRTTSNPDRGIATLAFEVTNQDGDTVQQGTNQLMIKA